jgi:hypothetical protein
MPKVSLGSTQSAPLVASPEGSSGPVQSRAVFAGDRDPIHLHLHRLEAGATMPFAGLPTDCLLYVWEGTIEAGGVTLGPRSSAIIEHGASLTAHASGDGATLLAFRMKDANQSARAGGHVHLMPGERAPRIGEINGKRLGMALHADAQCPTCSLWLHENDFFDAGEETALHSHSEDEVIFVRAGSIRLGNRLYGPGTALAIAANTKYGFFTGPDGLSFANFRGTSPTYRTADGAMVLDEAELWHTHVGKPDYLEPVSAVRGTGTS